MIKISAVIHSYNNEKIIEKCLKNVSWADEIINIDMYSSDKTRNIVSKFTDKIYLCKKLKHVALSRNFGLSKATGDWILSIDVDETLSPGAEKIIKELIQNKAYDGYWFPRRNYVSSSDYLKYGYFYPDYQLRLFRNMGNKYSGRLHENIFIPLNKTKKIQKIKIIHDPIYSKLNSFLSFIRLSNYADIEAREIAESNISIRLIINNAVTDWMRHFYRSYIKKRGYLDGYKGFRAAMIISIYQSFIMIYALYFRVINYENRRSA